MTTEVPSLPDQANRHFMGAVVDLSDKQEVVLSEDVYSKSGVKLLAKGAKVSSATYDRVVNHKLSKPIESCLVTAEQPSGNYLACIAEDAMQAYPLVKRLCNWSQGRVTPVGMLSKARLSATAGTLLNVSFARSEATPRHSVMVSLIAMCLANAHAYNDSALMGSMCLAGLLHDAGELYVDPAVLKAGHKLEPHEWLSYSYHPVVGAALAREICHLDGATQRAILEHHESSDGFGYPRSLRGAAISTGGKIMALAEILAALIVKPCAEGRIAVALKIMPSEHDSALSSLVFELLHEIPAAVDESEQLSSDVDARAHEIFIRIANVLGTHDAVLQQDRLSKNCLEIIDAAFDRFINVQRAFTSTGIANLGELGTSLADSEMRELRFEAKCVLNEIAWRLQKISRELILKAGKMQGVDAEAMVQFASALAGGQAEEEPHAELALGMT